MYVLRTVSILTPDTVCVGLVCVCVFTEDERVSLGMEMAVKSLRNTRLSASSVLHDAHSQSRTPKHNSFDVSNNPPEVLSDDQTGQP